MGDKRIVYKLITWLQFMCTILSEDLPQTTVQDHFQSINIGENINFNLLYELGFAIYALDYYLLQNRFSQLEFTFGPYVVCSNTVLHYLYFEFFQAQLLLQISLLSQRLGSWERIIDLLKYEQCLQFLNKHQTCKKDNKSRRYMSLNQFIY